ncbi:hypothetical protein RvY_14912 [Ramazzottius varieornatus]|uniref:Reverse transcriptase domain-containing protein n=1 Tax=Ramazzottius varieornatus TaxID=947166 RepID=A0A1D1VXV5_RAMVA|nr:hypothetical protein RvY_14912 [Ramazzottius varieornatus]
MPEFFPFVFQLYGTPSNLLYGEHSIQSARGVQKGDPLGPLLFCLLTRNLTKSLQSPFNLWYLDDATLGGDLEQVCEDLRTVVRAGAALGLELNLGKCEVFAFGGTDRECATAIAKVQIHCPGILLPQRSNLTLLGVPLFNEAIPSVLKAKRGSAELTKARFEKISSDQALFLLKNCLNIPKLLYVLRCSPTYRWTQSLHDFDDVIRRCTAKIVNIDMDDSAWRQASLPVANGGLGLRCAAKLYQSIWLLLTQHIPSCLKFVVKQTWMLPWSRRLLCGAQAVTSNLRQVCRGQSRSYGTRPPSNPAFVPC